MAFDGGGGLESLPLSSRIVARFLSGPLRILFMVVALVAGAVAILLTPREEEPQIVVPLADVFVSAPGLSAEQVERQVSTPLQELLYQFDGVEDVYSMSKKGRSIVTVRFYVAKDGKRLSFAPAVSVCVPSSLPLGPPFLGTS